MARPTDPLLPPIANWEQPTLDPYERAKGDKDKLYPGQSLLSGQPIPEMVKPPVQYPGEVKALPQPLGGGPNLDQSPISTGSGIHSVMGTTTLSDGRVLPFGSTPKVAWGDTLLPPIPKGFTTKPLTVLNGIAPEPGTSEQEADLRTSPYDEDPDEKEETPAAAPQGILKSKTGLKFEEWEIAFPGDYLPAKAFETPDGVEYGVDMGQVRYNMSVLRAEQLIKQEAMKKGRALTEDEVQPIFLKVADEVEKALQEGIEKAQGFDAVWVSATDEGLAEKMAADVKSVEDEYGKLPGVAYATLLTAKAWMNPHTEILYQPGEDTGAATPRQRGAWDTLHWLGQGSLGTVAMSTYLYGLGSKEQYEAIQSGKGVGEMMPEYLKDITTGNLGYASPAGLTAKGLRALGIMDDENEDLLYQIASVPASMAVAFFDPDAILASSFGLGKAIKVPMVGVKALRSISKGAQAAEAWEAALKGANSAWVDARKTSEGIDRALKSFTTKVDELVAKGETTAKAGADDKSTAINELYNSTIAEVQKLSPLAAKAVEWYIAAYARTNKSVPASVGVAVTSARAANARLAKAAGIITDVEPAQVKALDKLFRESPEAAKAAISGGLTNAMSLAGQPGVRQVIGAIKANYIAAKQVAEHSKAYLDLAEFASKNSPTGVKGDPQVLVEEFKSAVQELKVLNEQLMKGSTPELLVKIEGAQAKAAQAAKTMGESSQAGLIAGLRKEVEAEEALAKTLRETLQGAEAYLVSQGLPTLVNSEVFFKVADQTARKFKIQTRAVTQVEVIKKALGDVAKSYDMLSGDLRQGVKLRDITAPGAAMAKAIEMRKEILTFGQGPAMGAYVSIVDKIITTANLTAMNIKDAAENASRLGRSTLGQSSDVVLQAGKGALDSSRTSLDEVTRLIANSADQATALSQVIKYMDSGDESLALTNGATTVMNLTRTGNTTLWTEGWNTLSALARAKSIDAESPMIQGLARAFFPAGREGATHAKAMQKWVFDLFSAPEKLDKAKNAIAEVAAKGEKPTKKMLDELTRAQALVDGTKTFGSFMELLKVRTAAEFGTSIDTINRLEDLRGTVFASQAIANATFLGKAADTVRAELVGVSNQAIVSAANITAGLEHRAGEGFAEAFEVFSRLQIPPKLRIQALDTAKDINNGLVLLEKEAGEVGIINRSLMAELDARFAGLIKATDEFAARSALPEHVLGSQTMGKMLQIWRTSLTSGTLLPRPGHFVNMYFGNFAQMGSQAGWSPAMRVYANEGLSLARGAMLKIPGVRAGIDRYNKQATAKVGSSLGSMVENLFNTHVASFFDPKRCPASAKITDVGGKVYEMGALREAAKAQGVMQSFASSAIKELTARDAYSKGASSTRNAMRYITGEHWKDLVDTLEVRQRVGLFMDLVLNKGFTPEKAGKVVRDSLYDWGHAMAPVESSFLARVGLFWRFRKLMLRQGAGIIMAPFQSAYGSKTLLGAGDIVEASAPWRRTRQMLVGAEGVSRTLNEAYTEELNTSQQLWDEHLRQVYPWWTSKGLQPVLLNVPLDESERLWHRATGEDATHAAYTMPALTPLESTAMAMGAMATLGAFTFSDLSRKELMGKAIEGASGFVGPATALAMQGFADRLLGHTYTPAAGMKARPYEEAIASLIPGLEPVEVRDTSSKKQEDEGKLFLKDPGKTVMDQSLLFLFRNTPIIGNEAASWIDPMLSDPVDRKGYIEGAEWLIRQWTGVGKEYAHNPALTLSYASELGLKEAASAYSQKAKLYPKSSLDRDAAQNVGYAYKDFEAAKK